MKRAILFTLLLVSLTVESKISLAVVKFADEKIEADFNRIYEKHELIKSLYAQLSSSDLTYIIRYGNVAGHVDGLFETDGENLYLTFNGDGQFSLQAQFAHEATHALQFEAGRIAFFKNKAGIWKALYIDVWDEAEAFLMMIPVATGVDLNGTGTRLKRTNLKQFKSKLDLYSFEKAAEWLSNVYPNLDLEHQNNPIFGEGLQKGSKYLYVPYNAQTVLDGFLADAKL
jgi:hypothetical protein